MQIGTCLRCPHYAKGFFLTAAIVGASEAENVNAWKNAQIVEQQMLHSVRPPFPRGKETAFPAATALAKNGGVARPNGISGSQGQGLTKIAHKFCANRQAILC